MWNLGLLILCSVYDVVLKVSEVNNVFIDYELLGLWLLDIKVCYWDRKLVVGEIDVIMVNIDVVVFIIFWLIN